MPPTVPQRAQPRPTAKKGGSKAKSAPKTKGKSHGKSRETPGLSEEEAEEAAGYERHHAAELEEESRRHTNVDAEAGLSREEEIDEDDKVHGINFDDERKKRGRQSQDDDDPEDGEAAAEAAAQARKAGLAADDGAGKYFQDMPEDRMGDLSLTDPNEIKRALGPSVRFAQHAMLLAEERMKEGISRDDALAFLASMYTGLSDKKYANKALREFGHATGIVDIYPLELIEHLLEHVPGFCTKVRQGSVFSKTDSRYEAKVGEPITLTYPEDLRIRGFAIEGGSRPGYLFEPMDPPGTYQLIMLSAGRFTVAISAITKDGWLVLERLDVEVEADDEASFDALTGLQRELGHEEDESDEAPKKKKDPPEKLEIHFKRRI